MTTTKYPLKASVSITALILAVIPVSATAAAPQQDRSEQASRQSSADTLFEEILVTATKKSRAENLQDVPVAITAFNSAQLDALQVRNLQGLSYSVPNVQLEDIGTIKGVANFSIRGLGINSSIPSIDPTVGVFVDGIYLGTNFGVVFDTFDLEAIEILRGPQGLLFGRNVTGGAVVVRTKTPTDELEISGKTAVESGLRGTGESYYAMGSVSGPLVEGKLRGKLAVYYNDDKGWHENQATGENVGASETFIIRPVLNFTPTDRTDITVRYEHGEVDGDGPVAQNQGFSSRNSFTINIDEVGFVDSEWDAVTIELNQDVSLGEGRITNIFGWRDVSIGTINDIDATPNFLFHTATLTEQDQISNELRYSGRFADRFDFTTGFFYFEQDISYQESRFVPISGLDFSGGGLQDHETWGVFAQADIDLTDNLILTAGGRYSEEDKEVQIATLLLNARPTSGVVTFPVGAGGCDIRGQTAPQCPFDFAVASGDPDARDSWNSFTPKVGLKYVFDSGNHIYAHWTRGFRSGGYNFRNTSVVFNPGPFDQEEVDSYEAGFKYTSPNRDLRLNGAVFFNDISDLQREVNLPDPVAGVVQIIRNTADAEIFGVELEGRYRVTDNFVLTGTLGYLDGDYTEILFDLTGDGVINSDDLSLDIPRLADWTYGFGAIYDASLGNSGTLTWQVNFNHRDATSFTDNNVGRLNSGNILNASVTWQLPDERLRLTVYGKNILNEVTQGGNTILPFGTFAPLNRGNVFGLEFQFDL